jgi:hypothetical protein
MLKSNKVYLDEKYSSSNNKHAEEEMIELEYKFNTLLEEYKKENNSIILNQMEIKIRKLASQLNTNHKVISVEALFEEIARERRLKMRR